MKVVMQNTDLQVVFDLVENYLDKAYHIYFDNFYTGLRLIKNLALRNTFACGTVQSDRGDFPKKFTEKKIKTGCS